MRVLLDADVPVQLLEPLRHLTLGRHDISHVNELRLTLEEAKDVRLLAITRREGFMAFVTNDTSQRDDPDECAAIASSGLHHIVYTQKHPGLKGLALALGALIAALPTLLDELAQVDGQRLARVISLDPGHRRHELIDPATDPPAYWPRRRTRANQRNRRRRRG